MALTKAHNRMIDAAAVIASDWGVVADGSTDDTTALQTMLTANQGKTIIFDGTSVVSSTVTVSGDKTKLIFRNGAGISYATATLTAIEVSGDDVEIDGLNITGPATFDGANVTPTYASLLVTGDGCEITNLQIQNVPKVGLWFKDCNSGMLSTSRIFGNFPSGSFTGTETAHFAVIIDPAPSGRQGNFIVSQCDITTSVQGVFVGNYGSASLSQAVSIFGCNFSECWNHGVYGSGSFTAPLNGVSVSSNTFTRCQIPVAMTGSYCSIIGNTMHTSGSTGTYTDVTGISLREASHCVVANNTIQGDALPSSVIIDVNTLTGTVCKGNVISGNTVKISSVDLSALVRVGGASTTDLTDNVVTGNVLYGGGRVGSGGILFNATNGTDCSGSIISNNTVTITGDCNGIVLSNASDTSVSGNKIRFEHDAAAPVTLAGIGIFAASKRNVVDNNTITVTSAWGANISLRGIWETTGASDNIARNNTFRADLTKLTAATHYVTLNGSEIIVQDTGAGDPNSAFFAGIGSTWSRTDGGAGTSFYVKETAGTSATGWVGK